MTNHRINSRTRLIPSLLKGMTTDMDTRRYHWTPSTYFQPQSSAASNPTTDTANYRVDSRLFMNRIPRHTVISSATDDGQRRNLGPGVRCPFKTGSGTEAFLSRSLVLDFLVRGWKETQCYMFVLFSPRLDASNEPEVYTQKINKFHLRHN